MRILFALAVIGFGIETILCAQVASPALGVQYRVIPVIPWLPAIPWLAYAFGIFLVACGVAIATRRGVDAGAFAFACAFTIGAIVLVAPKYAMETASVSMRTALLELLAIASLAFMASMTTPRALAIVARYVFALCLIVFGVDHFEVLASIAGLIPGWLPWHMFWAVFFGVAFIVAGIAIIMGFLERRAYLGIGLMYAIWVVTLHLPRTLGLYHIPGAVHDPSEWSSLLIAVALCAGALWRAQETI